MERVIGSIRRECLDHVIIFDENSLRRTLRAYFSYYHRSRLHLSLDKDSPDSRQVQSIDRITAFVEVGGCIIDTNASPSHSSKVQNGRQRWTIRLTIGDCPRLHGYTGTN